MLKKIVNVSTLFLVSLTIIVVFLLSTAVYAQSVPPPALPNGPSAPAPVQIITWGNFLVIGLGCLFYGVFKIINRNKK